MKFLIDIKSGIQYESSLEKLRDLIIDDIYNNNEVALLELKVRIYIQLPNERYNNEFYISTTVKNIKNIDNTISELIGKLEVYGDNKYHHPICKFVVEFTNVNIKAQKILDKYARILHNSYNIEDENMRKLIYELFVEHYQQYDKQEIINIQNDLLNKIIKTYDNEKNKK